jgi:hypothetical protein
MTILEFLGTLLLTFTIMIVISAIGAHYAVKFFED